MEDYVGRNEDEGGVGVVARLQEGGMEEGGGCGDGMRRDGGGLARVDIKVGSRG